MYENLNLLFSEVTWPFITYIFYLSFEVDGNKDLLI